MPHHDQSTGAAHENPLTDDELRKIRRIVQSDERVTWLWATARIWATWIAAVVLGVTVGWDALVKIIKLAAGR